MLPAIRAECLSKSYRIGVAGGASYRTLRESLTEAVVLPWRWLRQRMDTARDGAGQAEELWALKEVSFTVQAGEVLGVIGRNGAGKSTLLKILSRITKPTSGRVALRGRVGSLLEVGTGFHPELSGRENIYLNGAMLGMHRREVTRKFDEIVAFAEIDRFLDTPVKRYSSGMYTRLAFAVAAHLEPEVLIVDEVLAVGDTAFQKKCLGKMQEVSRQGRTVLFVSHNMMAVKSLCDRAILIERGQVAIDGAVDSVVNRYLTAGTAMARTGQIPEDAPRLRDLPSEARFRSVRLTDSSNHNVSQLYFGQPFRVHFVCDVLKEIPDGHFEISLSTLDGTHVTYATTLDGGKGPRRLAKGRHEGSAGFDVVLLPRDYTIDLGVHHHDGTTADFVQRCLDFTVIRVAEDGGDHYRWERTRGLVRAGASWCLSRPQDLPEGA
jgi:lipopolysaccharide transport system ATP-binding protein